MSDTVDHYREMRQRIEEIIGDACLTKLDVDEAAHAVLAEREGEIVRLRTIAFGYNETDSDECRACRESTDQCPYHRGMDAGLISGDQEVQR